MEEEEEPLSPSLLEEEEQEVVEDSDEEEMVAGTPPPTPRLEVEVVPTSPVILSQRRVMRRRRGFGSETGLASQQLQIEGPHDQGATGIQDNPQLDEAVDGEVESIPDGVHHLPDAHALQEVNGGVSEEAPLITAEESPINEPTDIHEEGAGIAPGEDQEKASASTDKKTEARPRKKRKRVSEDEVKEHD